VTNVRDQPESAGLYQIPLLVGVVGSRELDPGQIPAIREAIAALLRSLRDAQPDVQVKLLCSLCEGADLLAAAVAGELGIDVVALLPVSAERSRAALRSEAARASFDAALQRAERLEVPPRGDADRAGSLIALYSSLLIVVWDGNADTDLATARAVDERLGRTGPSHEDRVDPDALLFAEDNDLMYEIRCSLPSDPAGVKLVGFVTGQRQFGHVASGIPTELATLLERTAGFNRDVINHTQAIEAHGYRLMPGAEKLRPEALAYVDRLFTAADWLGGHFRRSYARALRARYLLWATMVALLIVFDNHPGGILGFISISGVLAIFVLAALLAQWARRRRWHRRFLDYRALAEGLRVDFYWELGGVRMQFDGAFAHESFLQKQDVELEWIRAAMRAVSLRCALYPRAAVADGLTFTAAAWVGGSPDPGDAGQLGYYRKRATVLARRESVAGRSVRAMLLLGLTVCCALAVDSAFGLSHQPLFTPGVRVLLIAVFALFTAYGAIFGIYFDERSDKALILQYRHMEALFSFAERQLHSARSNAEKLEILRSLGHACLAEHAQWILAHRDRRVEGMKW
jgi:hypothetical protein